MGEEFFIISILVSIAFVAAGIRYNKYFKRRFGYNLWAGTLAMAGSVVLFYYAWEKGTEYEHYILFLVLATVITVTTLLFNILRCHNIPHGVIA